MTLSKFKVVGVEFAVERLSKFRSDMASAGKSMDSVKKKGSLLGKAFSGVGKILGGFLGSLRRIGEFLLAGIIFRGLEAITGAIKRMIGGLIEAGAEFQQLQIRLEGLIASDLRVQDETLSFADSMQIATGEAKELFRWITNLALQTPFDIKDVADTITLAKAYGLTTERAKEVTTSILDFASGMGLTEVQMKRVIENFGQMIQQGKITGTELRDLARGALVPVNDILSRVAENMGDVTVKTIDNAEEIGKLATKLSKAQDSLRVLRIRMSEYTKSTKESTKVNNQLRFDRLQKEIAGYEQTLGALNAAQGDTIKLTELTTEEFRDLVSEGVIPVNEFMDAFVEIVGERFPNAGERAGKTIKAVVGNLKDLFQGLVAFNVVTPVLDVIAERMDNLIDTLTTGARGEKLQDALKGVGENLVKITETFFGFVPTGDNLADFIIKQVELLEDKLLKVSEVLRFFGAGKLSKKEAFKLILRALGFPETTGDFILGSIDFVRNVVDGVKTVFATISEEIGKGIEGFEEGGIRGFLFAFIPEDSGARTLIDSILETFEKLRDFWNNNKDNLLKIWTELLQPLTTFVLDFTLSGLTGLIDFLTFLVDMAINVPTLSKWLLGVAGALLLLVKALNMPVKNFLLVALLALGDVLTEDSIIVGAVDKFTQGIQDAITGFADLFVEAFIDLGKIEKQAVIIGELFMAKFVLGVIESKAFQVFNDEVVVPLAKLMGKTFPTSTEIAERMRTNIGDLRDAGLAIGSEVSSGIREGANIEEFSPEIIKGILGTAPTFFAAGQNLGVNVNAGIANGLISTIPLVKGAMNAVGGEIIESANRTFILRSPSKIFERMGNLISQGLAQGILKGGMAPVQAINMVGTNVNMAAQAPSVTNNTTTQNFNMNIATNARSEPIIGNFRQLQALGNI